MQEKLKRRKKLNLPPGPAKLPIIGNLHQLGNMPHISLRVLAKKYGPIIFLQLGEIPTVVISSVELAKEVLKTHDLVLCSRPQLFSAQTLVPWSAPILLLLLMAPLSEEYKESLHTRSCSVPSVSTRNGFVREEEVARLIRSDCESYPGTTNLSKMIGLYGNDVLCRVALGRDFSGGGEYDRHGFQKMLDDYQALLGGFRSLRLFSFDGVCAQSNLNEIETPVHLRDGLISFFDEVIIEHRNSKGKQEEKKDLVDILLDIRRMDLPKFLSPWITLKPLILVE
ncbi:FLAVONOID 3'-MONOOXYGENASE-RELATED [Salix viminalis]|uniref:FLAVONOID 3'-MONOOXYGENASE-RELATED n=1 Tax=Salix viminalis TaxID=40686 RepID=A0A9Q0NMA9_SALVM|nr:FLAVONOID 3'-MONOOXYGENASE-RELATED [Salix viminalis]